MEFMRAARDRTGLDYAALAGLIGVTKKTLEQNAYGATKLTSRNRSALEIIIPKYANGRPLFSATPKMGDAANAETAQGSRIRESGFRPEGARGQLRHAREARRLTIKELAKLTKVSASHLASLEEGRAPLSDDVFRRLKAVVPDLDREELMGGSEVAEIIDLSGRTARDHVTKWQDGALCPQTFLHASGGLARVDRRSL